MRRIPQERRLCVDPKAGRSSTAQVAGSLRLSRRRTSASVPFTFGAYGNHTGRAVKPIKISGWDRNGDAGSHGADFACGGSAGNPTGDSEVGRDPRSRCRLGSRRHLGVARSGLAARLRACRRRGGGCRLRVSTAALSKRAERAGSFGLTRSVADGTKPLPPAPGRDTLPCAQRDDWTIRERNRFRFRKQHPTTDGFRQSLTP